MNHDTSKMTLSDLRFIINRTGIVLMLIGVIWILVLLLMGY